MLHSAYTVEMERMGATSRATWHGELNDGVGRQDVDGTLREQVLGRLGTAHNLQHDGNGWLGQGSAVDLEGKRIKVKDDGQVDVDISTTLDRRARSSGIGQRMEVSLAHDDRAGRLRRGGVNSVSSDIAKASEALKTWGMGEGDDLGVSCVQCENGPMN